MWCALTAVRLWIVLLLIVVIDWLALSWSLLLLTAAMSSTTASTSQLRSPLMDYSVMLDDGTDGKDEQESTTRLLRHKRVFLAVSLRVAAFVELAALTLLWFDQFRFNFQLLWDTDIAG